MRPRDGRPGFDPPEVVNVLESGDSSHCGSPQAAAGHMEAIDVENGEYTAVYGPDGTVFELSLQDGQTKLHRAERKDPEALQRALRTYRGQPPEVTVVYDPYALVNAWQVRAWERRWPRWPPWLAERLHGIASLLLDAHLS